MSLFNAIRLPARNLTYYNSRRTISSTVLRLASKTPRSEAGQVISDVSKQEGGTYKGKIYRHLSSLGFTAPSDRTVLGSTAARMQSEVTKRGNDYSTNGQDAPARSQATGSSINPSEQSQVDRKANYVEAADMIGTKMATDPASVTKEDGDLLHSRETKAFGTAERGGIASQAQSLASENAGDKR